jgi:NAD binding domain of 6-phosphogluconate dehydrogenase
MAKIAFLGLGQMGAPMAARLLQAGHELTVWNRTPDRAKPLAAGGATVAKSPAEAGAGAAFAITMVATPEALKDVVLSGKHSLVSDTGRCPQLEVPFGVSCPKPRQSGGEPSRDRSRLQSLVAKPRVTPEPVNAAVPWLV